MTEVRLPYQPREVFVPFHMRKQRWAVIVAHRRAGKTVAVLMDMLDHALRAPLPNSRYAFIAPYYVQAKTVAWDYLKLFARPVLAGPPNESELRVDLINGSRISLFGGDNGDRLRGLALDGVALDEFADQPPSLWGSVIRPALADRRGWATIIGTIKGRNQLWKLYDESDPCEWYRSILRASQTGILDEAELLDLQQTLTPEAYAAELECDPNAAILGAYYGKDIAAAERAGRIKQVDPIPDRPVHTAWDLGMGDSTAIWFWQAADNEIRIIDHYENHGQAIPHYVAEIEARGYLKGTDYVPHDAKVRSLETGRTRIETLISLGRKPMLVANHKIMDGINAARLTMPRIWFDADKCRNGIEALRQYRADFDEKTRAFKDAPKHDWCFTGDTKVLTRYGMYPIKELPNKGEVLTPCGWKPYHSPRLTRTNARVVAVRFADGHSVRCTPDHLFMTANGWRSAESLARGTPIQSTLTLSRSISTAASTVFGRAIVISQRVAKSFTATLGLARSVQSHAVATSTTGTATQPTTLLPTWNVCQRKTIFHFLGKILGKSERPLGTSLNTPATLPQPGTGQTPGGFGIAAMQPELRAGKSGNGATDRATNAVKRSGRSFVRAAIARSFAALTAKPLIIAGVEPLSKSEDVYCITVPGEEAFSLANGAVVHNCSHTADAFRYLCMAWREQAKPVETEAIPPVKAITDYRVDEMWKLKSRPRDRV